YNALGKVYSYDSGTSTPRATYPTVEDALAGTNANTNPIILDSDGKASIVIKGATRLVIRDADDNLIDTFDGLDQVTSDVTDENGNNILAFTHVEDAVNYWRMT